MSTPTVLVILDGFGWSTTATHNAIASAYTPHLDYYLANYPHTLLQASGTAVGLPAGIAGNSEVGHLTIGSGRVTPEDIVRIHAAINDGSLAGNPIIQKQFSRLAQTGKALHLIGLISDAGVHSDIEHVYALLKIAKNYNIHHVYIHAILDGRDVAPKSAAQFLQALEAHCTQIGVGKIASIIGRFYAMDRDNNWTRTEQAYNLIVTDLPSKYSSWQDALDHYYHKNITDEFIPATLLDPHGVIHTCDGIVFFNFRPDRARQLSTCFANPSFNKFPTKKLKLAFCITMTDYNAPGSKALIPFAKQPLYHTLKDVLSQEGKTIVSIAETEKYAHVTYFFTGDREEPVPGEIRILIPSIHAKNYIHSPCMSAQGITNAVITSLDTNPKDFYIINYANADMVGHSGDFNATVQAIECLDKQLGILYQHVVTQLDGTLYITGDHGKAEDMFDNQTQQPKTAHTTNPVPFIMMQQILKGQNQELALKELSDVAPFILKYMGLPVPKEMQKISNGTLPSQ